MAEKENPKGIEFVYKEAKDHNTKYVSGAYGGMNPEGKLVANFYHEKMFIPDVEIFSVKNSKIDKETREVKVEDGILREIQVTLIMDYNFAKSLKDWLNDKIENYEKLLNKNDQGRK